jgi:hypothetical protein
LIDAAAVAHFLHRHACLHTIARCAVIKYHKGEFYHSNNGFPAHIYSLLLLPLLLLLLLPPCC